MVLFDKMVQTSTIVAATVGTIATGLVGITRQKLTRLVIWLT